MKALQRRQPRRFGHVLENFVRSELMKADHAADSSVDISFYRTNDGRETVQCAAGDRFR